MCPLALIRKLQPSLPVVGGRYDSCTSFYEHQSLLYLSQQRMPIVLLVSCALRVIYCCATAHVSVFRVVPEALWT